jgi:plastocyanin
MIRSRGSIRRASVTGRPLIAVIVAAVVTIGAAAFALGRGVASDSGETTTVAATTAPAPQGSAAAAPVTIQDFAFSPETVTVKVGSAITWTNGDGFAHSVKSGDGSFVSQDLQQGQSYTATFAAPGTFAYVCGIHNSMTGTVVVEP